MFRGLNFCLHEDPAGCPAAERVVFSKDADFIQSHLLRGSPARLLIVTTGNISNKDLSALLLGVLPELINLFESHVLNELNQRALIVRH